jgi:hypothetical protein
MTTHFRGGEGPPLVLIHGYANTWRVWEPVLPALTERHDVLAPTLCGHFQGEPLAEGDERYDLRDLAFAEEATATEELDIQRVRPDKPEGPDRIRLQHRWSPCADCQIRCPVSCSVAVLWVTCITNELATLSGSVDFSMEFRHMMVFTMSSCGSRVKQLH